MISSPIVASFIFAGKVIKNLEWMCLIYCSSAPFDGFVHFIYLLFCVIWGTLDLD